MSQPLLPIECELTSFDGTKLFYRAWLPSDRCERAVLVLHRGHEHSGRVADLVRDLHKEGTAFFAWDARGHGRSPGERGAARHFTDLVRDLEAFARHVSEEQHIPFPDIAIVAHSVSAVVVAAWLHGFAPRIRCVVLATPAFDVKLYVPFAAIALRAQLALARRFGWAIPQVKSYVTGKLLTHDPEEARTYDADPLVSKQIAVNVLLDLLDVGKRLVTDAAAIRTPILVLVARTDWVVKNGATRLFFDRLSSRTKRIRVYRGFFHSIFHERERARPVADTRAFLEEMFAAPADTDQSLISADAEGYTSSEYQWLSAALPPISLRRLGYRTLRLFMRTLGSLSEGIRIGWKTGFDSGSSLDYVYRNHESGRSWLGRFLDRIYLDTPGWTGIRARKKSLESLLDVAIDRARALAGSEPVRIVDLAGGPGRYLLDIAIRRSDVPLELLIRDSSEAVLEEGRVVARSMGLANVVYERADAFDEGSLSANGRRFHIAVVSGLFELFPANEPILTALRGIARALVPGGQILYTNQPWHPQLELIAEVLMTREGKPWVMRRRTQAEMDALASAVGFEKRAARLDDNSIFTVSLASLERPEVAVAERRL